MITGVNEDGGPSVSKLASKNYQVYVIEDSMPPTSFPQG